MSPTACDTVVVQVDDANLQHRAHAWRAEPAKAVLCVAGVLLQYMAPHTTWAATQTAR